VRLRAFGGREQTAAAAAAAVAETAAAGGGGDEGGMLSRLSQRLRSPAGAAPAARASPLLPVSRAQSLDPADSLSPTPRPAGRLPPTPGRGQQGGSAVQAATPLRGRPPASPGTFPTRADSPAAGGSAGPSRAGSLPPPSPQT
jgi:hypothetical protein